MTLHEIKKARKKDPPNPHDAVNAFSQVIAHSTLEAVKEELEGIVEKIRNEVALKSSSPFVENKVWFSTKELMKRWGCSLEFIYGFPGLEPENLGGSRNMKRYLAIDVYRAERLITKAQYKELKKP